MCTAPKGRALRCIGPKTGVNFAHFGLESGMVFIRELGECTNVFTVSIPNMSKKEGEDRDDKNQPCTCIYVYLRRVLLGILGGSVPLPVLQILTLYQTKICHFSHPFSNLAPKKLFHHNLD